MMLLFYSLLILFLFLSSRSLHGIHVSNITLSDPLFPNQTLVSSDEFFELGFFTPNGSTSQYVGIWFKSLTPTKHVWVANRDTPLSHTDHEAILAISSDGNLNLVDGQRNIVWSTNVSKYNSSVGTNAFLLDSGNLVLRDGDSSGNNTYIWSSYDQPCDTLLQGMKIGLKGGELERRQFLVSWKSDTDPTPGNFSVGLTSDIPPQAFTWRHMSTPYWRAGPWDKSKFIGISDMDESYLSGYRLDQDIVQGTTYFSFSFGVSYSVYMFISSNGTLYIIYWDDEQNGWLVNWEAPRTHCDFYGTCGPFGVCNPLTSPICRCLKGFVPNSPDQWGRGNWTRGCIRHKELMCTKHNNITTSSIGKLGDRFLKMSRTKLPDYSRYAADLIDSGECQIWCSSNCSCLAFAYVKTIGCLIWMDELIDIQQFNVSGEDFYFRVAHTEAGKTKERLTISLTTISSIIVMGAAIYGLFLWKPHKRSESNETLRLSANMHDNACDEESKRDGTSDLPVFDFTSIIVATSNFHIQNKLGQGGFGPVYKGKLPDGKEIAVKRLSSNSGQGMVEFKNELNLISKLQHRNLVKLIGCCTEGKERLLLYEYLPNKSLDTFIFDSRRKAGLNWERRFSIIQGIARGLLYLHRDSCLRIIHRDLKASNILLDENMNPKISDFGLARMFEGTQDLLNTHRVVGTFGYMSPEYAMGGVYSEKSDIYSFGVLLLETVSSKRSSSLYYLEETMNLLSYTWKLWREGRAMELLDDVLTNNNSHLEVKRCVQIGLLCVQDHAIDRPNMATVVLMLSGDSYLPEPKPPTLTSFQNLSDTEMKSLHDSSSCSNTMTNTMTEGR